MNTNDSEELLALINRLLEQLHQARRTLVSESRLCWSRRLTPPLTPPLRGVGNKRSGCDGVLRC